VKQIVALEETMRTVPLDIEGFEEQIAYYNAESQRELAISQDPERAEGERMVAARFSMQWSMCASTLRDALAKYAIR
jgi:hypothetical protein